MGKFFNRCRIWMKFGTRVCLKRWNDRGEFELDQAKSKNNIAENLFAQGHETENRNFHQPRGLRGRASTYSTEGCGFDPLLRHIKSRKKMVPVAPLLTLGIKRWVLGNMAGRPGVSLQCDWVGCSCQVPATGALQCGSTLTCIMQVPSQYDWNNVKEKNK